MTIARSRCEWVVQVEWKAPLYNSYKVATGMFDITIPPSSYNHSHPIHSL